MKKLLIYTFLFFCSHTVNANEAVDQAMFNGRTMEEIQFKYRNLMKRDSYYGDEWFANISKSFDLTWNNYQNKTELLELSNNHVDVAKFIAYFHQNADPDTLLDKHTELNSWFNKPIASLHYTTPYYAVRKGGEELALLKFMLQQSLEPSYYPKYGVPLNGKIHTNNEQEKVLIRKLKTVLLKKDLKLMDLVHVGMEFGSNNQDTYIIFNNNWEVWYTERGGWDLLFFTENYNELVKYIISQLTIPKKANK